MLKEIAKIERRAQQAQSQGKLSYLTCIPGASREDLFDVYEWWTVLGHKVRYVIGGGKDCGVHIYFVTEASAQRCRELTASIQSQAAAAQARGQETYEAVFPGVPHEDLLDAFEHWGGLGHSVHYAFARGESGQRHNGIRIRFISQ